MTVVDFYTLSRAVQDSLTDSLRAQYAPLPIVMRPGPRRTSLLWLAIAGTATVLLAGAAGAGFGHVASALAIQPVWAVAIYIGLAATAAIGLFNAIALRARIKSLPFPPGVFLFPTQVIDARESKLRVYSLKEMSSVAPGGSAVVIAFGGARFSFPIDDPSRAGELVEIVEAARDRASVPIDPVENRRLDPLAPPSVLSPLAPDVAHTRDAPTWERWRYLIGAGIGAAVGAGLFFERNALSDAAMLDWAKARDDVASYTSYLAHGARQKDLVARTLLPRAALKAAVARASVDAIDEYIKAYPSTDIQPEIDAARKAALLAEFGRARSAATFDALLSFAERHPDHGAGAAFDEARHALYIASLERSKKEIVESQHDFAARLVADAEKRGTHKTPAGYRGTAIQIRLRRVPSKDIDHADDLIRKSPMFNGSQSLLSAQLDANRFAPHERALAEAVADRFSRAFDPEVVTFEPGPPLDNDLDPAAIAAPVLAVSYRVESSGAAYASKKPHGIFLGLLFYFGSDFAIPRDTKPLKTKLTFTERVPLDLLRNDPGTSDPGVLEGKIYDTMTHAAFEEIGEKYLGIWFKKPKAAR